MAPIRIHGCIYRQIRILFIAALITTIMSACAAAGKRDTAPAATVADLMAIVNGPENKVSGWERWQAIDKIGRLGTLEAAEALLSLFGGPMQGHAALALPHITDKKALPLLIPKLSHEEMWVRMWVCDTIGLLGGDDAVAALLDVARNDSRKLVRQTAVHALRWELWANPEGPVIPALFQIAKMEELTEDAVAVLRRLRDKAAVKRLYPGLSSQDPEIRILVCEMIRNRGDADSTDRLLALLKNEKDQRVVSEAALALSSVFTPGNAHKIFPALMELLRDEESASAALDAIDDAIDPGGPLSEDMVATLGKALLPALKSKNHSIYWSGTRLFQKLNYPEAAPVLIKLIPEDEGLYSRQSALIALGNCLRKEKEVRFLIDWGRTHSEDSSTASDAIDRINHPAAVRPLIEELSMADSPFVSSVIAALARLKNPAAAQPLLQYLIRGTYGGDAAEALIHVAGKKDLPRMLELLKDKGGYGRRELAISFTVLDRLNGFGRMKALMEASGEEERDLLSYILNVWPVVPSDEEILLEALTIEDNQIRIDAIGDLARIDSIRGREAVCRVLQDEPDRFVREAAAKALGEFADTDAIQCLISAYKTAVADENLINLKEAIQHGLWNATGQEFDEARQWQAWLDEGFGSDNPIDRRIQTLNHKEGRLRLLAAREIALWPDRKEQRMALVPIMELMEKGGWNEEKVLWARILGMIGDPRAIRVLSKQLENRPDIQVATAVAGALAKLGNLQGIEYLIRHLDPVGNYAIYEQEEVMTALSIATGQPLRFDADFWKSWWAKQQKAG